MGEHFTENHHGSVVDDPIVISHLKGGMQMLGTIRTLIARRTGFFLKEDIASFDAQFFSITAKEAAGMDPAKRLLLEVSYEAFENGRRLDFLQSVVRRTLSCIPMYMKISLGSLSL
ncbi:hypothetical protein VSDG_10125 [Cytospora chrysosperma]|uniref:Beta-ketoacyl synthase-like N-terminal domain-containing protein n=1 Tax=Cytospora chrysosperma TaxID=252740 RepID=A0A423V7Z9_CYTCH|nr:hypothetical protein VSDG_10125 [Valsa sordida]